jgi:hypothetical protein
MDKVYAGHFDAGVVRRRQLPSPGKVRVFELTAWGRALEPIVAALGTWALAAPADRDQPFVSADSGIGRRRSRPPAAEEPDVRVRAAKGA